MVKMWKPKITSKNLVVDFLFFFVIKILDEVVLCIFIMIVPDKIKWWEMILDPVEKYHHWIILKLQILVASPLADSG